MCSLYRGENDDVDEAKEVPGSIRALLTILKRKFTVPFMLKISMETRVSAGLRAEWLGEQFTSCAISSEALCDLFQSWVSPVVFRPDVALDRKHSK